MGRRPVLLELGPFGGFDLPGWTDRVRRVLAEYDGAWGLPVLGVVPAPASALIRPDGYVAWGSRRGRRGFVDALTAWFGPPGEARRAADRRL